jgi:hypothetical protein
MAINSGPGKAYVRSANMPQGGKPGGATKGSTSVANGKGKVANISSGKMPDSAGGVTLGTTHNQHHVAHRLSSSSPATGQLQKGQL